MEWKRENRKQKMVEADKTVKQELVFRDRPNRMVKSPKKTKVEPPPTKTSIRKT